MEDTKRAELEAAYAAVMALLDVVDTADCKFRVAVMGETRWGLLQKGVRGSGAAELPGVEALELARCPAALVPAVFRHVLDIAQTPIFRERCLNSEDDAPEIDPADAQCVIHLAMFRAGAACVDSERSSTESGGRMVTVSGMHLKVGKRNSA
jgi:hypothetical protein